MRIILKITSQVDYKNLFDIIAQIKPKKTLP